jgi:hypothetical protein
MMMKHTIVVMDRYNYYNFVFDESRNMTVSVTRISSHNHISRNEVMSQSIHSQFISILAKFIMWKQITFKNKSIMTTPMNLFSFINSTLCAVRIRVIRLRYICLKFTIEKARRYRYYNGVAKKIQRIWKRAITNPTYELCRKRLLREFQDMVKN